MSADKRSVATDALETLGTFIDEYQKRDAIHLAVEPVIAGERLWPGADIRLRDGKAYRCENQELAVGIVDPFLPHDADPGQRFWLVVYPRKITSLRHVWSHPDFPESELTDVEQIYDAANKLDAAQPNLKKVAASEAWIRKYADEIDLTYNQLMTGADDWVHSNKHSRWPDYLVMGGILEGVSTSPEFWIQYEILRDVKLDENVKTNFFSCSC